MTSAPQRHQLFISYSKADREWVVRLKTMLSPLVRGDDLRLWDDSQIEPGARWQEEIRCALATAKVAMLLVSPDFLHSDFVNNEELPPILRAAEEEGLVLLWVKLRHCLVHRTAINAFQAAFDPRSPLADLETSKQEEALAMVAEAIADAFQKARDKEAREQEAKEKEAQLMEERVRTEALKLAREMERERLEAAQKEARERETEERAAQARAGANRQATGRRDETEGAAREAEARERSAPAETHPPGLPHQRLPAGETAELLSAGSGLLGKPKWRVQRRPLQVWGFLEKLAPEVSLAMVEIPGGTFSLGSPAGEEGRDLYGSWRDDWKRRCAVAGVEVEAQRRVAVPPFWLGRFPITQAEWRVVAGWQALERELDPDPSHFKGADHPVEQVSWEEAWEFCRRLSRRTGHQYSLPSEAHWEWACRAGTDTPFHFGATLSPELANFRGTSTYADGPKGEDRQRTTPVGRFPANGWGLHDMHGNVWEWCLDRWHPAPANRPTDGSAWLEPALDVPQDGRDLRLLRGGSWFDVPHSCRSAYRGSGLPGHRSLNAGFRVCCLPPGSPPKLSSP